MLLESDLKRGFELLPEFYVGCGGYIHNPALRYACTGLSMCKTYGLPLNKIKNVSGKNYVKFV